MFWSVNFRLILAEYSADFHWCYNVQENRHRMCSWTWQSCGCFLSLSLYLQQKQLSGYLEANVSFQYCILPSALCCFAKFTKKHPSWSVYSAKTVPVCIILSLSPCQCLYLCIHPTMTMFMSVYDLRVWPDLCFNSLYLALQEGDAEIAAKMQDLALAEGALPKHLHTAMFTQSTDSRMLTNRWTRFCWTEFCQILFCYFWLEFHCQWLTHLVSVLLTDRIQSSSRLSW